MKKHKLPTGSKFTVLRQLCNYIPPHLVPQLARDTGVEERTRTFSPWSHVVALSYAQLSHSIGLNDVCDALQLNSGPLSALRGATPPSRNNLSHANKVRDAAMAEGLFWAVLKHLGNLSPGFISGKAGKRWVRRLKRKVHLVDSTTIQLIASCMDWAKHRRRKAAAKCHVRLDLQSFLPRFAIIDTARHADAQRAWEVCAGIREGEIALFDKAYVDFGHLSELDQRGVIWVTRAKENLQVQGAPRVSGAAGRQDRRGRSNRADQPDLPSQVSAGAAAVGGVGGGRGRGAPDGIPDQPVDLESRDRGGVVSVSLADRGVLQANQADAAVGRLSGDQRQRGAVANLDSSFGLLASAVCGLLDAVGA